MAVPNMNRAIWIFFACRAVMRWGPDHQSARTHNHLRLLNSRDHEIVYVYKYMQSIEAVKHSRTWSNIDTHCYHIYSLVFVYLLWWWKVAYKIKITPLLGSMTVVNMDHICHNCELSSGNEFGSHIPVSVYWCDFKMPQDTWQLT